MWSSLLFAAYAALTGAGPTTRPPVQSTQRPSCPTDRNYQIVPSPFFEEDRTVFLGDEDRLAVWRSTDAGITWTAVYTPGLFEHEAQVYWLKVPAIRSPSGLRIYLVYFDTEYYGWRIVRSRDSGATWDAPRHYYYPVIGPEFFEATNQPDTLFRSNSSGLFRSDDDTLSWQRIVTGTWVNQIYPSPTFADDQILFARFDANFHISHDGGMTWEERHGLCPGSYIYELAFSPDFTADQRLFANEGNGLTRSQDGGQSWVYLYPQDELPCQYHNNDGAYKVRVSPDYPNDHTVFMSTASSLRVSYDDGLHWRRLIGGWLFKFSISRQPEAQLRSTYFPLALGGGQMPAYRIYLPLSAGQGELPMERPWTLFATSAAGENYRSDDGGVSWQCLNLPPADLQDTTTHWDRNEFGGGPP